MSAPAPRRTLSDQVLFVVLGTGLRAFADLAIGIALARLLSRDDFGTYRQVFLIYGTLAGMVGLGLPASLSYFIPLAAGATARPLAWRTIALIGSLSTAAALVVVLSRGWLALVMNNPALGPLLLVAAAYPACLVLSDTLPYVLVALGRHAAAGGFSLLLAGIQVVAVLAPALMGVGLYGLVLCATGAAALKLILALIILGRATRPPAQGARLPAVREQLRYAIPLGVNLMTVSLYQRLDRFLVSLYYPPTTLAIYSVGAAELPLVPVLPYTVGRTLIPHFVQLDREGRRHEILRIWHRSIVSITIALLPVFALCFLFAPEILGALYGAPFREAAAVFRIYLLLLPLRPTTYGTVLQALGDTRSVLQGGLLAVLLNLALGLALIPLCGWLGPAAGAVLAQVALIAFYLSRIARAIACPWSAVWPWRRYLMALGITALAALAAGTLLALPLSPVLCGISCIVVFLGIYGIAAWRLGWIGAAEREMIRRWLSLRVFRSA